MSCAETRYTQLEKQKGERKKISVEPGNKKIG